MSQTHPNASTTVHASHVDLADNADCTAPGMRLRQFFDNDETGHHCLSIGDVISIWLSTQQLGYIYSELGRYLAALPKPCSICCQEHRPEIQHAAE